MSQIEVLPATIERFADVAAVLAPRDPDAPDCWCLSYREPVGAFRGLTSAERPARLRRHAEDGTPPGVIATVDEEPAGRCSVRSRSSHHRLNHSAAFADVGTTGLFASVGFERVVQTSSKSGGQPRWLMLRTLASGATGASGVSG